MTPRDVTVGAGRGAGAALGLAALTLLAGRAYAALPPPTGGALRLVATSPALDPRAPASAPDLTVAGAIFEGLYRLSPDGALEPVLARAQPELDGTRLRIPLRPGVRAHDGRTLGAEDVAAWLRGLARADARSSFVALAFSGGRAALAGKPSAAPAIEAHPEDGSIRATLIAPSLELARVLAAPEAAIAVPGPRGSVGPVIPEVAPGFGTGPFMLAALGAPGGQLRLDPFPAHLDGRPFLDALLVGPRLPEPLPAVAFDGPGRGVEGATLPEELTVLAIGDRKPALQSPEVQACISAALHRAILAPRFVGRGARARHALIEGRGQDEARAVPGTAEPGRPRPEDEARTAAPGTAEPGRPRLEDEAGRAAGANAGDGRGPGPLGERASILIAREDPSARRIAERVQLDLLRASIAVVIEAVPANTLAARRRDRQYELLLDTVATRTTPASSPLDRLFDLLSLAGWAGAAGRAITDQELAQFLALPADPGRPERLRMLATLDRAVRARVGLIPLAARTPLLVLPPSIAGAKLLPDGRLDLANAWIRPGETP